jgi:hypothetical protein
MRSDAALQESPHLPLDEPGHAAAILGALKKRLEMLPHGAVEH